MIRASRNPVLSASKVCIYCLLSFLIDINMYLGYTIAQSGEDPQFGAYNTLMCRSGMIASFPQNASISKKGIVVAMDFIPYSGGGSTTQTIFSIRNTLTNTVSLRADYFQSSKTLNIWINPIFATSTTPYYVLNSTIQATAVVSEGKFIRLDLFILNFISHLSS